MPRPKRLPPSYTLADTLELLGLSNPGNLHNAHLPITKYSPGVYDAEQVEDWAQRLARRRAWIALDCLGEKARLADAPATDMYDVPCPECESTATLKRPDTEEEREAWIEYHAERLTTWPAACGWCEWRGEA